MGISVVREGSIVGKTARMALFLLPMIFYLSGCLSVRPSAEKQYIAGTAVTSLSSNISLTYTNHDRSISGSGYFMYQSPDHIRVVILSPFGSVLQEIYVVGERVTIIDPANGIAFNGSRTDLPDKGDFSGWRYINWLIDIDPSEPSRNNAVIARINRFGQPENASFDNGCLISKRTSEGGTVRYGRYTPVQGIPYPLEIKYDTVAGEKFIIQLEDPEVNVSFSADAFTPNLSKLRVYPLLNLK